MYNSTKRAVSTEPFWIKGKDRDRSRGSVAESTVNEAMEFIQVRVQVGTHPCS